MFYAFCRWVNQWKLASGIARRLRPETECTFRAQFATSTLGVDTVTLRALIATTITTNVYAYIMPDLCNAHPIVTLFLAFWAWRSLGRAAHRRTAAKAIRAGQAGAATSRKRIIVVGCTHWAWDAFIDG